MKKFRLFKIGSYELLWNFQPLCQMSFPEISIQPIRQKVVSADTDYSANLAVDKLVLLDTIFVLCINSYLIGIILVAIWEL